MYSDFNLADRDYADASVHIIDSNDSSQGSTQRLSFSADSFDAIDGISIVIDFSLS